MSLLPACSGPSSEAEVSSLAQSASSFLSGQVVANAAARPAHREPPQPEPPSPREAAPPIIRGIYVNAYAAGTPAHRKKLLALADSTEINAFVVDVKDDDGIRYRSAMPLAQQVTHGGIPIRDLKGFVDTLRAHGIYPIARIVVFKDRFLAQAKPEWAIRTPTGALWIDKAGNRWMSAWSDSVREYNIRVAEEAARAGFREIQFDYVRFPEAFKSLPKQVHPPAPPGARRADAIAAFLSEAKRRLHPLGVTVTADLFGLSMDDPMDVGIGQQWEALSSVADALQPMVYPSHFFPTHLPGIHTPNRMPYETVYTSVGMGVIRNQRLREQGTTPARIVPWIQAFSAPWVDKGYHYGPTQARAQTQALYDLGVEDWIFWNAGSNYDAVSAGFARGEALPQAKRFDAPQRLVRVVNRFDREGVAEARQRVLARAEAGRVRVGD
ncbi:MAG: putative glycoside hydrolase [Gemmatimonadetes bacterium]|nr:putative glycoside hydrolase [Gemmatimonadota bacterium]